VVTADQASAADWSLKYNTSTDLEFTDNLSGTASNKDAGLKLTSRSSFDLLAKTKTQLFRITPSVQTRRTFFADYKSNYTLFPSLGIGYTYEGKRTTFGFDAYVAQAAIRSDNLLQINGVTVLDKNRLPIRLGTESGSEFDYGSSINLSHRLTKKDSLNWSAGFSSVDYSIDTNTLDPNDTLTTSLGWQHSLTQLISTSASTSISYYHSTKTPENDRVTYNPNVGVNAQLTKRLSGSANFGLSFTDPKTGKSTFGGVGSISGTYALKTTKISGSLSRNFSTATNGDLRETYNAQLNVVHSINDLMSMSLAAGYGLNPVSNGPDKHSFVISPALNYQFAKDWNSSLSYNLSSDDDDAGHGIWTNAVLFNLSYGKTLLK
jgi:hypothetical protein